MYSNSLIPQRTHDELNKMCLCYSRDYLRSGDHLEIYSMYCTVYYGTSSRKGPTTQSFQKWANDGDKRHCCYTVNSILCSKGNYPYLFVHVQKCTIIYSHHFYCLTLVSLLSGRAFLPPVILSFLPKWLHNHTEVRKGACGSLFPMYCTVLTVCTSTGSNNNPKKKKPDTHTTHTQK